MVSLPRFSLKPFSKIAHSSFIGKYVGNRPIKLRKADTNVRPVEIGHKKAKQLEKELKKNRHKPY